MKQFIVDSTGQISSAVITEVRKPSSQDVAKVADSDGSNNLMRIKIPKNSSIVTNLFRNNQSEKEIRNKIEMRLANLCNG